jgi:glycosyltransferase involved in cell wall biosynthesis
MRVLFISAYFPVKRTDFVYWFVRDEACELVRKGLDVHMAFWKYSGRLFRSRDLVVDGTKVHGLKLFSPVDVFSGFGNLRKLPFYSFSPKEVVRTGFFLSRSKQVEKIVKRYDVDVIHAHFAHPEGLVGSFAKQNTHKPLVISVLGYDVQSDPKSGYGALSRKDTAYLVRKALVAADAIIVGAESHYKTVIQLIGEEKKDKVHFISAGIDTDRFNPNVDGSIVRKNLGITVDQPVILFARHLRPIYGVEYLIKAIPQVIEKCPEAVFLILGEGPLLTHLQELADSLKITGHVKFLGQVRKAEMPFYYTATDIFVDPCIFGQGYAASEALSCGKPVVGFKVGQIKVEDRKDGFLVEFGNVEEIARKIICLAENPSERQKMGAYGRKRIEKYYSLRSRIGSIIHLYKQVMSP